jgi:uncharacterized membrane protein
MLETATAIAVVTGVTELVKQVGLDSKYAPVVSLLLGIGIAFLFYTNDIAQTILSGVIIGLSASGLYSGTKTIINK